MKNPYANLEKEYHDTILRLSALTGWPAEQAESVVGLVVQAAEKKAHAVTARDVWDLKNARYHATKKLLQNYRSLREAIKLGTEHTLRLLEDTEYQRLMEAEESQVNQKVTSVALQAGVNQVLWARINVALDCLKEMCQNSKSAMRGYKILYKRYLSPREYTVEQIWTSFHVEKSTYHQDLKTTTETLSILLFGMGNTEDFILREKRENH